MLVRVIYNTDVIGQGTAFSCWYFQHVAFLRSVVLSISPKACMIMWEVAVELNLRRSVLNK